MNYKEKFQASQNTSEASLFGYNGPSRINTLQREQDMKIDTINEQLNVLTHINNEQVLQNQAEYKKIPIGNRVACRQVPAWDVDDNEVKQERWAKYFTDNGINLNGSEVKKLAEIL